MKLIFESRFHHFEHVFSGVSDIDNVKEVLVNVKI